MLDGNISFRHIGEESDLEGILIPPIITKSPYKAGFMFTAHYEDSPSKRKAQHEITKLQQQLQKVLSVKKAQMS